MVLSVHPHRRMDNFTTYMLALCLLFSLVSHTSKGWFCASVIGGNWLVWSTFITLNGDYEPWALGVALDSICACLLLWPHMVKARAWLALTYCLQIAAHVSYGISVDPDPIVYYWSVSLIGWAQLIMVGGRASVGWLLLVRERLALFVGKAGLHRIAFGSTVHVA